MLLKFDFKKILLSASLVLSVVFYYLGFKSFPFVKNNELILKPPPKAEVINNSQNYHFRSQKQSRGLKELYLLKNESNQVPIQVSVNPNVKTILTNVSNNLNNLKFLSEALSKTYANIFIDSIPKTIVHEIYCQENSSLFASLSSHSVFNSNKKLVGLKATNFITTPNGIVLPRPTPVIESIKKPTNKGPIIIVRSRIDITGAPMLNNTDVKALLGNGCYGITMGSPGGELNWIYGGIGGGVKYEQCVGGRMCQAAVKIASGTHHNEMLNIAYLDNPTSLQPHILRIDPIFDDRDVLEAYEEQQVRIFESQSPNNVVVNGVHYPNCYVLNANKVLNPLTWEKFNELRAQYK